MENEQDVIKEVVEKVDESLDMATIEQAVMDNKFEFDHNDLKLRVRKPTFGERQQVYKKRIEKFTELLKDPNYLLESALKKQYLDRGIDIDGFQEKIISLEKKKKNILIKLGEELTKQGVESDLNVMKEEVQAIEREQLNISLEKSTLMEFCIEQQVFSYVYTYLTFLISEKLDGDKWVKLWDKIEDMEKDEDLLVQKVSMYATFVMKDEIKF